MTVKPFNSDLIAELIKNTKELSLTFSQNIEFIEFQALIEKEIEQMQKTLESHKEIEKSLTRCVLISGKINAQKGYPKGFYEERVEKIDEIIAQRKKELADSIFISSFKANASSELAEKLNKDRLNSSNNSNKRRRSE